MQCSLCVNRVTGFTLLAAPWEQCLSPVQAEGAKASRAVGQGSPGGTTRRHTHAQVHSHIRAAAEPQQPSSGLLMDREDGGGPCALSG